MKTKRWLTIPIMAVAMMLSSASIPAPAHAQSAQVIKRLAANFLNFDDSEIEAHDPANLPATPVGIYSNVVKVPGSLNTLYVTISATGDVHHGAQMMIQCLVDGLPCNAGTGDNGAPAGFVVVQEMQGVLTDSGGDTISSPSAFRSAGEGAGDLHDNNVYYSWCTPIEPLKGKNRLLHTVALNLATSGDGDGKGAGDVFLEQIHVFVDASKIKNKDNACTPLANP